jgi:SM-20-related protein
MLLKRDEPERRMTVMPINSKVQPLASEVDRTALDFLRSLPGITVRHSGSTLIEHLIGVRDKLAQWECRPAVRFAGLYHSIYGTENFRQQTVPVAERPRVAQVIGTEAEHLAYEFCMLTMRGFLTEIEADLDATGGHLRDSGRQRAAEKLDLLHLFAANWLEQMPRMRAIQRSTHVSLFRKIRPLLPRAAQEDIEAAFNFESVPTRKLSVTSAVGRDETGAAISVLDDFVPAHLRHALTALTERNIWRYGWKAAPTQTQHHFWHSHFAGDNEDSEACCEAELGDRPLVAPVLALWHLIRDNLAEGHVPVRVYANGHTYGGDGHLHTDDERPGHFTSIYYAHADWHVNWGGETVFFDPLGRDVVKSVFPRPGRLVHFPGHIPHAARSPSRDCPALRAVFVVKTFCPPLN